MTKNAGTRPAEIFGHLIGDRSKEAQDNRERYWCPFVDRRCSKRSRLIDFPFGVCSVKHGGEVHTICPRRFEERGTIEGVSRVLEDEDGFSPMHASRFALYDLVPVEGRLTLTPSRFISTTVDEVYQAMRNNPGLPGKDRFVQHLNAKLRLRLSVQCS